MAGLPVVESSSAALAGPVTGSWIRNGIAWSLTSTSMWESSIIESRLTLHLSARPSQLTSQAHLFMWQHHAIAYALLCESFGSTVEYFGTICNKHI